MQSPLRHGKAALGTTIAGGALAALSQAPERASRLLRHRYPTVAVTGMTGVGKTRLADRLSRRASAQSAGEAGQDVGSAVMERRTRRNARLRGYRFRVVPGENAATRLGALDEVFHDEPVDGVLHVVANGYATPRRTGGTTGTALATREEQLAAELEDWSITAHRIASMAVRRERPTWLVIAVTKADLFADDIDAAVALLLPRQRLAVRRQARRAARPGRRRQALDRRAAGVRAGRRQEVRAARQGGHRAPRAPRAADGPAQRPRLRRRDGTAARAGARPDHLGRHDRARRRPPESSVQAWFTVSPLRVSTPFIGAEDRHEADRDQPAGAADRQGRAGLRARGPAGPRSATSTTPPTTSRGATSWSRACAASWTTPRRSPASAAPSPTAIDDSIIDFDELDVMVGQAAQVAAQLDQVNPR